MSLGEVKMSKTVFLLIMIPDILLLNFFALYFPKFTREGIFFGVRIPYGFKELKEFKELEREYKRNYAISMLIPTIALILIFFFAGMNAIIKSVLLYTYLIPAAMFLNYYKIYKKVLSIKKKSNWFEGKTQVVTVSLKRREDIKNYPSKLWFVIPAILIVFNIVITILRFPYLPDKLPLHYDINGQVNRWGDKSFSHFIAIFLVQVGLFALLYLIYRLILKGKLSISPINPEKSQETNELIKIISAKHIIILAIVQQFIFVLTNLNMLLILNLNLMTSLIVALTLLTFLVIVLFAIKIYNLIKHPLKNNLDDEIIERDDDEFWKMGLFYYNPDDPSLFVEKRIGIGWDFNYAHPVGKAVAIIIILTLLSSAIFILWLPL